MMAMTLAEVATAVGGQVVDGDPDLIVSGPATVDSRAVPEQGLFVAIAGERVDGHDYAAAAISAGAAAVLGSRPTGVPTVLVEDATVALGLLANEVLGRLRASGELTVLALTGSQGKTSTKDYLAQILAAAGPTVATAGNLNNELGVPLTVLRAEPTTRYLVVEMGARGVGHIAELCRIAEPDAAAVLNVGTAHVGEFGSQANIALAKGEIVEALRPNGVAALNADDVLTRAMATRTSARIIEFGAQAGADGVSWHDVEYDELVRARATLHHAGASARIELDQTGTHHLANAAAATALALGVGLELPQIAAALSAARNNSQWRMERHNLSAGGLLINDSYNANPASMLAALDALAQLGQRRSGPTVAVLGEMKELGSDSDAAHRAVGVHARAAGIDVLLTVGEVAAQMQAPENTDTGAQMGVAVSSRDEALAWLLEHLANVGGEQCVILVKASRAAELDRLAEALLAQRQPDSADQSDPEDNR